MSKPIKITPELAEQCKEEFVKALLESKLTDGKLNFSKTFTCGDEKATVCFTSYAWSKMAMLIKEFDKEVAWHGVAKRGEKPNEYIISDIVVYPQTVTAASVDMDTEAYSKWLMENCGDERFDSLFMQGHSHVNMATSPSSTDLKHQSDILNMLGNNDFYIFMIWNKSFSNTTKVYDMQKNLLFEDKDVSIRITGEGIDLDTFLADAKSLVKTPAPKATNNVYPYTGSYGAYHDGYGDYYDMRYNNYTGGSTQSKKEETKKTPEKKRTKA